MRVKDIVKPVQDVINENNAVPKDKRQVLKFKLKTIFDIIKKFEETGEAHKDDVAKVETLKYFISNLVKEEKVIKLKN